MKNFILAICVLALAGQVQAQHYSKATLQATGLTCALCSNAINKALLELPFVDTVRSEIKTSSFKISFKEGEDVSIDGIRQAVEDAGFSVGKLEITGSFENLAVEKDQHLRIGGNVYHFLNAPSGKLNGVQTLTLADKGFVTPKEFKKLSASSKMACVQSGRAESCCTSQGVESGARVFHVTI
jgi:copper chaperone CopZ